MNCRQIEQINLSWGRSVASRARSTQYQFCLLINYNIYARGCIMQEFRQFCSTFRQRHPQSRKDGEFIRFTFLIYPSQRGVVIAFKQRFQMNYQQHRNLPPYSPLPQFSTSYHPPEPPLLASHSHHLLDREASARAHPLQAPFNIKEYSFEMKEYFRPQQKPLNAPLTFNLQSPTKLKAKKGNRPVSKAGAKSFVNPFTQQLENEFFKDEPNPMASHLEDFSKTTSTINGQSFLNLQHVVTEPSEDRIYTPLKSHQPSESSKVVHSNSVKILFEREPQNKNFPNVFNHSSSSYLQRPAQACNSKSRENAYILDQRFLLQEIKGLKQINENYQKEVVKLNLEIKTFRSQQKKEELRNSRKQNKIESRQLELQFEQNNKLLAQIEEMEQDMKGKVDLNRYLEHQCNLYSEKHDKLQQQFDSFKTSQAQESSRQEQIIGILKKQVNDLESERDMQKIADKAKKEEIAQLKKSLQLQGEKLQELSTNNEINKSQINVLNKKIENFQVKYQKLMHSHCQSELKLHDSQETMQKERIKWQQAQSLLLKGLKETQQKLNHVTEQKQDIYMQLSSSKGELIQANNKIIEMKTFYQGQFSIISQQLSETNKIVKSKTQENQHLHLRIQAKVKQIEGLQNKIRELLPSVSQLKVKNQENLALEALLQQKLRQYALLQQRQKTLSDDYNRISQQLQQKTNAVAGYNSEISEIKTEADRIQAQLKDMSKRYEMLRVNYEAQSARCKQLQANLIQNQFDYNILQRDFREFSIKCNNMQMENDNLRQLNLGLQSLRNEINQNNKNGLEALQAKNIELVGKIQGIYAEYNEFKRVSEDNKRQAQQKIEEFFIKNGQICNNFESLQQQLKIKANQCSQYLQKMRELEAKCALIQSQYKQQLQQYEYASLAKQADLSQSSKSQVETWELLSKKQIEIELLQSKIDSLESTLQSKNEQLIIRGELLAKEQLLKQQISSLMLIIDQNENRDQSQKHQLLKTIDSLTNEMQSLSKRHTEEGLQYKSIISELKQSIQRLEKQDGAAEGSQADIKKAQASITKAECEGQLKQWNSFNEYHSSESIESPSKVRLVQSAEELQGEEDVDYIQMDREGVNYLCELLQVEIGSGNILSQIVARVESAFSEISLCRRTEEAYRQVLEAFGVQEGGGSSEDLMREITTFKESLGLVIEQLKEEQQSGQALRSECHGLRIMHEAELQKGQQVLQELSSLAQLNSDLSEAVLALTARLCNQKMRMAEAMSLTRLCISDTSIRSEKFVTARSISEEGEAEAEGEGFSPGCADVE